MNTFTLRRVPPLVERSLRRRARESHKSLNKTAIELLEKAVGLGSEEAKSRKRRDVKNAIRKWTEEEYQEFERNTKVFDSIDEELWRK